MENYTRNLTSRGLRSKILRNYSLQRRPKLEDTRCEYSKNEAWKLPDLFFLTSYLVYPDMEAIYRGMLY